MLQIITKHCKIYRLHEILSRVESCNMIHDKLHPFFGGVRRGKMPKRHDKVGCEFRDNGCNVWRYR